MSERHRRHRPRSLSQDIRRVWVQIMLLVLLVAVTAGAGLVSTEAIRSTTLARHRPAVAANEQLLRDLVAAQSGLRAFVATGDETFMRAPTPGQAELRRSLDAVERLAPATLQDQVRAQEEALASWWAFHERVVATRRAGRDAARLIPTTPFPRLVAANRQIEQPLQARVTASVRRTSTVIMATGVALALETVVLAFVLMRTRHRLIDQVVRPLTALRLLVSSGGRAHPPVDTEVGPVEVRELGRVVKAHVQATRQAEDESALKYRLDAAQSGVALAIRRELTEEGVLDRMVSGLQQGLTGDDVRLLAPEPGSAPWEAVTRIAEGPEPLAVDADAPVPDDLRRRAEPLGEGPWMAVTVRSQQGPAGAVVVEGAPGRRWRQQEIQFLEQVCTFATRGIDQSRFEAEQAAAMTRLRALDRQKTDFMATVSHELRTPLTSIAGYLEMLEDGDFGPLPADQADVVGVLSRNTARLRALIEDLLVLSRIESSGVKLRLATVRLQTLVDDVVENLRPQAIQGAVTLRVRRASPEAVLRGDPDQLERALTNVIGNALKFTPPGGRVTVDVAWDGHAAAVRVADTGIGIPEEDLRDVGRRFFRASNVTAQTIPGTGLGLSIVQSIAAAHGGRMSLDSVAGQGTTVTIHLTSVAEGEAPEDEHHGAS